MRHRAAALAIVDRPHVPRPGNPSLARFKEWWHFTIVDDRHGLDLIVNLSIAGDIRVPDAGDANLVLLVFDPQRGWHGGLDLHDGLAASLQPDRLDIRLGASSVRTANGAFDLTLARRDGDLSARLQLRPVTEPLMVWKNTPLGRGFINWLILPYLVATGELHVAGRSYVIENARAYHDHNWGEWLWGDNFGWEWGVCSAACDAQGGPLSFVYDRTVDRGGHRALEHSLMLWRADRLQCVFSRHMLTLRRIGVFRESVRRLPGVAGLIEPAAVGAIPERLEIHAVNGRDRIEASYVPDTALQIALPRETGFGLVAINETMGWLTLAGSLGGERVSATRRACFEFVG